MEPPGKSEFPERWHDMQHPANDLRRYAVAQQHATAAYETTDEWDYDPKHADRVLLFATVDDAWRPRSTTGPANGIPYEHGE